MGGQGGGQGAGTLPHPSGFRAVQGVRVTLAGSSGEGRGRTVKTAREGAARALLERVGPWLEPSTWEGHTATLAQALPPALRPWLPPVWDARHLELPAPPHPALLLYEVPEGALLPPTPCLGGGAAWAALLRAGRPQAGPGGRGRDPGPGQDCGRQGHAGPGAGAGQGEV